jgi:hypothetical protein
MTEVQEFDIESMTIAEMELVEDIAGASFEDIMAGKARTSKVLKGFALVVLRRDNPEATAEDAASVGARDLNRALGITEGAVPFDPPKAAKPASRGSQASRKRSG